MNDEETRESAELDSNQSKPRSWTQSFRNRARAAADASTNGDPLPITQEINKEEKEHDRVAGD
ncbi:MAG: hypothetical protein WCK57_01865 [Verrucomicrobiae bacterium]